MADFSLTLDEDQLQIQKWVHDFAEGVVRPAAHEWDEREEFPWPIVEEAAQIGLYGVDFLMNAISDPTGLTLPVAVEELFWGDAGIGMAIMGSGARRRRHRRQRHARAGHRVGPAVLRHAPTTSQLGAFCVSEPDAGSDVSCAAHPRRLRRGHRRVGAQRHQGVDHQRRHRRRPRRRRRRRPRR